MTSIYLKVLLMSSAFVLNNVMNAFVRNDGNPKLSMIAMLGSFGNIILDYLLVIKFSMGMFELSLQLDFRRHGLWCYRDILFPENSNIK